jgi:hypothetical protein
MTTLIDITKKTYLLTFGNQANYDWQTITEVFIASQNIANDLSFKVFLNQNETQEKIIYWQDLFFMEIVELNNELKIDNDILKKIKSNTIYQANKKFIEHLPKATTALGRELLIDSLIENKDADMLIPDSILENVLKKKSRDDLRKDFEKWNEEDQKVKSINYKKLLSIAAILLLGLFIWQPNKFNDNKLIKEYAYNEAVIENIEKVEFQNSASSSGLRGEEFIFEGYSKMESELALKAISLLNQNEIIKAKEIFNNLEVNDKGNNQLLFFLAISEAYSNEEKPALKRFLKLSKIENFIYSEDAQFQSAMMFIKTDERKLGKNILISIIENKGKYETISKDILSKMRWF